MADFTILNGYTVKDPNALHTYDTVADLKTDTKLKAGYHAKTKGYYSANDGGSAEYIIREKLQGDVDTPLTHFIGEDLIAELIITKEIHSKVYGIKGDGETDETQILNHFFGLLQSSYNLVIDPGVYKTTDTIFIKGTWRQDAGNNGTRKIKFDHATINYQGDASGKSIVIYNMFKYSIDGLCVARDSIANIIEMVGCWHVDCNRWDVKSTIKLSNDSSTLDGLTYASLAVEYIQFNNLFCLGQIIISPITTSFINCINFNNSIIFAQGYDYVVVLEGTTSKQEINFYNSDLSYSTKSVFNVTDEQTLNGKGSINCIGCYFDSNISIFNNDNKKGMEFNTLFGMFPALSNNEIVNISYKDFIKNMNLGGFGQFGFNLPLSNINYAINGDLSYQTNQSENASYLMGANSAVWTKTYEDSNLSINGKCRHIKWLGSSENASIIAECITAPRTDIYSAYARLKITAGSCTGIQISFGGSYVTVDSSKISGECLIVNSKNVQVSENGSLNFSIIFMGASSDLEADIYEVGVTEGKLIIPNMPLHANAKISEG
ncbi:MAG: hypothetical protein IJH63_04475 [Methanobrevibacter sp.]|nr:hypothetical protein [Methanobrevibacter sp.]